MYLRQLQLNMLISLQLKYCIFKDRRRGVGFACTCKYYLLIYTSSITALTLKKRAGISALNILSNFLDWPVAILDSSSSSERIIGLRYKPSFSGECSNAICVDLQVQFLNVNNREHHLEIKVSSTMSWVHL